MPGARRAAKELDVDITWRGPLREDDRDSQVAEVENAAARRVSGIVLAPLDEVALVAPVMSAAPKRRARASSSTPASRAASS